MIGRIRNYYAYIAEFAGTFALMFAGTGGVVYNAATNGGLGGIAGVASFFGLLVAVLVILLSRESGIHINPAVTIALWLDGKFPQNKVGGYLFSQFSGAILGSVAVARWIGTVDNVGATIPRVGPAESFIIEIVITAVLMAVVLFGHMKMMSHVKVAGIAGVVIAVNAFIAGPLTGASMNPARSFAPALVAGIASGQWVYIIAPILGGMLAVAAFRSGMVFVLAENTRHGLSNKPFANSAD